MDSSEIAKIVAMQLVFDNLISNVKYEKEGFSGIGRSNIPVSFRTVIHGSTQPSFDLPDSISDYTVVVLPAKTKGDNVVIFKNTRVQRRVDLITLAKEEKFIYRFFLEFSKT